MSTRRVFCLCLALVFGLGSCRESRRADSSAQAKMAETMPVLLLPPNATMLSVDRGTDITRILLRSELDPESVRDYYRRVLSKEPWRLVGDAPIAGGAIGMYAERKGAPPLWVMIRKAEGATGSLVDLTGAKIK
ncbi:MAG TPA: hypothetical protein VH879_12965 [Gemmatimonadales bacterium]|jgi:hypothetical protein